MAKTFRQPENINFMSPLGFRFVVQDLPNTTWFLTSINLPGITFGAAASGQAPTIDSIIAGDTLVFDPLNITFVVDEDLQNWKEIYAWMIGLGFPHTTDEYKDFKKDRTSIYSDGSLTILNSNMNPNYIITFTDLFPTSLSELVFDSELTDVDPIKATVSFQYLTYTWKKV
jgi:hypothetical protein